MSCQVPVRSRHHPSPLTGWQTLLWSSKERYSLVFGSLCCPSTHSCMSDDLDGATVTSNSTKQTKISVKYPANFRHFYFHSFQTHLKETYPLFSLVWNWASDHPLINSLTVVVWWFTSCHHEVLRYLKEILTVFTKHFQNIVNFLFLHWYESIHKISFLPPARPSGLVWILFYTFKVLA